MSTGNSAVHTGAGRATRVIAGQVFRLVQVRAPRSRQASNSTLDHRKAEGQETRREGNQEMHPLAGHRQEAAVDWPSCRG
jgi:hypothetical protein